MSAHTTTTKLLDEDRRRRSGRQRGRNLKPRPQNALFSEFCHCGFDAGCGSSCRCKGLSSRQTTSMSRHQARRDPALLQGPIPRLPRAIAQCAHFNQCFSRRSTARGAHPPFDRAFPSIRARAGCAHGSCATQSDNGGPFFSAMMCMPASARNRGEDREPRTCMTIPMVCGGGEMKKSCGCFGVGRTTRRSPNAPGRRHKVSTIRTCEFRCSWDRQRRSQQGSRGSPKKGQHDLVVMLCCSEKSRRFGRCVHRIQFGRPARGRESRVLKACQQPRVSVAVNGNQPADASKAITRGKSRQRDSKPATFLGVMNAVQGLEHDPVR